jgi:carbonic anhydrase/acetyltransferase-like protein (isoleucine patch superfamily)
MSEGTDILPRIGRLDLENGEMYGRYIDPTAVLIGNVELGDGVSVWPYAVIRADEDRVAIGE